MSVKVYEFLPSALNRGNDTTASGFISTRSGEELVAGGTILGDAIQLREREANQLSDTSIGLLHEGQYRRIMVDPAATPANIKTGTAAFVIFAPTVLQANVLTPGSGQTPGTYQVQGTGGGGSGAVISVYVSAAGTVTANPILLSKGSGYVTAPTFTLNAGGTAATFVALMDFNSYRVTTADKASVPFGRGVFLNVVTPGNYAWIQENGVATILHTGGAVGSATVGAIETPVQGGNGTFQSTVGTAGMTPLAFGLTIDVPAQNTLTRILMTLPVYAG